MSQLVLALLGGFEARIDAGPPAAVPTRKAQALLAYLALTPGQTHPRDKLAALLWPDTPPGPARTALRQTLFVLRKALGAADHGLVATGDAITLAADAIQTDVAAFERAVADATPAALEQSVALYRGDLLAGLSVAEPAFEDWLMTERERLRELALEALARLLAQQRGSGAVGAAVQTALRALALDPLQEPVHRTLMRLYIQLGRRDAALRQYQECVEVLQRELGVEPEPESKALYQEVLRQRPQRQHPGRAGSAAIAAGPGGLAEAPLMGRDPELARLHEALAQSWAGHSPIVAVLGEIGIGKSRLLAELAAEARRRGGAVLAGRSYESEQVLPFGPWVDALRQSEVLVDARALEGLDAPWVAELTRLFPELACPGLPSPGGPSDQLRLFEALARLVRHLAVAQPLLIVLEDAHWADEMSLRFLAFLARRLQASPILLAISIREEELGDSPMLRRTLDELAAEERLARLTLARLGRDDTLELVRLLGRGRSRAIHLAEEIWRTSDGNPFIVVETMRAIGDEATASVPLPTRVRDMIERRLDRLSGRARLLASVAAVIGREFEFVLLQRAAGLPEGDAAEGVEELVRRRVLRATGQRFDFTHDRIRETAYVILLAPQRRALHGAVARAVESVYGGDLESHCGALAGHYREAEIWDRAVHYLARFAESAARRYAHQEAVAALDDALRYVERLPGEGQDRLILTLVLRQAGLFHYLGRFGDLVARLGREEDRLERVGDPTLNGPYYFRLGQAHSVLGHREHAQQAARRAIAEAQRCDDRATMGRAHTVLSREAHWLGRPAEGIQHGLRAVSFLEQANEPHWLGMAHWLIGRHHYLMGEFDLALVAEDRARAIGEAHGDRRLQSHAAWTSGELLAVRGDWEAGIERCQRALEISPDPLDTANARGHLGSAYLEAGDAGQAIPFLEQAMHQFGQFRGGQARGWYTMLLGAAHLAKGDLEGARVRTRSALEILESAQYRRGIAWAQRTLGLIAEQAGALAEAEIHLRQALEIFTEISARFEVARTQLALALLANQRGDAREATQSLQLAHRAFEDLAAPRYVERAERLAAGAGVVLI